MKISVIIPCFNVELYINQSVSSVLVQTNQDFEIVLVDDGSTDDTAEIIKELATEESRISVITKKNEGVSSARNAGIKKATGDLIYFLDADDHIDKNLFQKSIDSFQKMSNLDMISFGYDIKSYDQIRVMSFIKYNRKILKSDRFLEYYFKKKIRQSICSLIVKRDLIIANDILFDEKTFSGEDQEFQIKLITSSRNILYLSDILFHYQIRPNSSVSQLISERKLTLIDAMERSYHYLESNGSSRRLLRFSRLYLATIYIYIYKLYIKSDTKALPSIESTLTCRSYLLKQNIGFTFSKYYVVVLLIRLLYKISPKLLKIIF